MKKKSKPILAWGGFMADDLFIDEVDDRWGGSHERKTFAIFRSRKAAREQFEDVRRVEIREIGR